MSRPPQTVGRELQRAVRRLRAASVDSPELDAELLLSHALGWDRSILLAHPERELGGEQADCFQAMLLRRIAREPLAYILGKKEFYGLELIVNHNVLIPRPETEELVELALAWLERRREVVSDLKVADVGTGSGAIALALAAYVPNLLVYALDVSDDALHVAQQNVRRHQLERQVRLKRSDLLEYCHVENETYGSAPEQVDLIVANLPYVEAGDIKALMPEVGRYEPSLALDGGADGLNLVRRLLRQAPAVLRAGGAIMLEIGSRQGSAAISLAETLVPCASVRIQQDLAGHDRILVIEDVGLDPSPEGSRLSAECATI